MKLIENETVLSTSDTSSVTLTNYRIYSKFVKLGVAESTSIFYEDISCVRNHYRSYIWIVFIAVLTIIWGIVTMPWGRGTMRGGGTEFILLGIVFLAIYWFTRQHAVSIYASSGKSIDFIISNDELAEEFIAKISQAKYNRLKEIHKKID